MVGWCQHWQGSAVIVPGESVSVPLSALASEGPEGRLRGTTCLEAQEGGR